MIRFITISLVLLRLSISSVPLLAEEDTEGVTPNERVFFLGSKQIESYLRGGKDWEQYVRGFRKQHHFSLVLGYSQTRWSIEDFATYDNNGQAIRKSEKTDGHGVVGRFRYEYHIQLYKGLGYLLGTSVGYSVDSVDEAWFSSPHIGAVPGFLGGLSYNFSSVFRLSACTEFQLERWIGLAIGRDENDRTKLTVTARTLDFFAVLDFFYELSWALRFEGHVKNTWLNPPKDALGEKVDVSITKREVWYGLGVLHHFL